MQRGLAPTQVPPQDLLHPPAFGDSNFLNILPHGAHKKTRRSRFQI